VAGDVAVVGCDDLPVATSTMPELITIRQPICPVGQQAVKTLLDVLGNGVSPVRRIVLLTKLVVRGSCDTSTQIYA